MLPRLDTSLGTTGQVGANSRYILNLATSDDEAFLQEASETYLETITEGLAVDFVGHAWTLRREHLR